MKPVIKITLALSIAIYLLSCSVHDPIDSIARIGEKAPNTYWEIVSTTVLAGDSVPFIAQYYGYDSDIDHSEVWYNIMRNVQTSVTCPLSTTFKYSVTSNHTDIVREYQLITAYPHSLSVWDDSKKAFVLNTKFPTSNTLQSYTWNKVTDYDQQKFETLFPSTFAQAFQDSVYKRLQVADLQKILTVDNPRMTLANFKQVVDSTFDANAGRYVYFIKEASKNMIKTQFYSIPFDSLLYDKTSSTFSISYNRVYSINARFHVYDKKGAVGFSDYKLITFR